MISSTWILKVLKCRHRVARAVAGPLAHGGDLFARKLARFDVRLEDAGEQPGLIVELAGEGPLVAPVLRALLHRGQYAGLFPLRHPPKPDGSRFNGSSLTGSGAVPVGALGRLHQRVCAGANPRKGGGSWRIATSGSRAGGSSSTILLLSRCYPFALCGWLPLPLLLGQFA
uniref:Uncharacterized protein n=1 Tax=Anopheles coluzzii TaxID=1518534 RepID=A0A8W7P7P8_ANOCL